MKEEYLLCACTNLTPCAVLQLLPDVTGRMLGWDAQCVILLSPFFFSERRTFRSHNFRKPGLKSHDMNYICHFTMPSC